MRRIGLEQPPWLANQRGGGAIPGVTRAVRAEYLIIRLRPFMTSFTILRELAKSMGVKPGEPVVRAVPQNGARPRNLLAGTRLPRRRPKNGVHPSPAPRPPRSLGSRKTRAG